MEKSLVEWFELWKQNSIEQGLKSYQLTEEEEIALTKHLRGEL